MSRARQTRGQPQVALRAMPDRTIASEQQIRDAFAAGAPMARLAMMGGTSMKRRQLIDALARFEREGPGG